MPCPLPFRWCQGPTVSRAGRPDPDPKGSRQRYLGALQQLRRQMDECDREFTRLATPESAGELRDYGIGKGQRVQQAIRVYDPEIMSYFHAVTGIHGDIMIPEDRLKAAVVKAALGDTTLVTEIDKLLGKPWDDELETFRHAGDGAPVRWLHQVV